MQSLWNVIRGRFLYNLLRSRLRAEEVNSMREFIVLMDALILKIQSKMDGFSHLMHYEFCHRNSPMLSFAQLLLK